MPKMESSKRSNNRRSSTKNTSAKRKTRKGAIQWKQHALSVRWLPEPNLVFASGYTATDPKEGLSLYGPYGLRFNPVILRNLPGTVCSRNERLLLHNSPSYDILFLHMEHRILE